MKPEAHYRQIDYQERQTIAFGVEQGQSMRAIGRMLGRSPSTISREIERNAPRQSLQLPVCPEAL